MKTWKGKVILLIVGGAVSLMLLEIGLALFYPQPTMRRLEKGTPSVFLPSEILPYRLRPNSQGRLTRPEFDAPVWVGSLGYRGEDFAAEKPEGTFRVLAVGDSFTFGWGVGDDETYSARLQEKLREKCPDRRIEVINTGFVSGFYPDTYYLYLREIGLDLDPDLVVIGFFVGNDIDHRGSNEELEWTAVGENGFLVRKVKQQRYRYPVLRDSHLVQALATFRQNLKQQPEVCFNHWMYRAEYPARTVQPVEKVQRLFLTIADLTRQRTTISRNLSAFQSPGHEPIVIATLGPPGRVGGSSRGSGPSGR